MSDGQKDLDRQMAAAREGMDRYRKALAALANPEAMSEKLKRKVEDARAGMEKYTIAGQKSANL